MSASRKNGQLPCYSYKDVSGVQAPAELDSGRQRL